MDKKISHVSTTQCSKWKVDNTILKESFEETLELTGSSYQTIEGFGGCFNELGWIALEGLDEEKRKEVLDNLFDKQNGCKFNFFRMPIGASDYAAEWYSHDEVEGDYDLEHFSIKRDYKYLIPYIKEAQSRNEGMKLFASPWSPPTWMKFPKAYNYGTLIWKPEILEAYAKYFMKFVQAYEKEGIKIDQVHIQNEPIADQKFPSCVWTGEKMRDFIKYYIGPLFQKENLDTEIWLGTINAPYENFGGREYQSSNYDKFANTVLIDKEARQYISGIGYQWGGKHAIEATYMSWPELKLLQTENECGDGSNSWNYAHYIYNLMWHYLNHGVVGYIYWNMVLEKGGVSTWGWHQNSMISIHKEKKEVEYNPEFYVMKHFSHYIKPGAVRLGVKGHWSGNSLVFKNPDGELVILVSNSMDIDREFTFKDGDFEFSAQIKAKSFNTFTVRI